MSRPSLPWFVAVVIPLVLLLSLAAQLTACGSCMITTSTDAIFSRRRLHLPVGHAADDVACCSRSAAAARVVESCTDDIVRSFFGVRGSDLCCHALQTVGDACYRAVFAGSPFADLYATILGNVCGGGAVAPSPGADGEITTVYVLYSLLQCC